MNEKFTVTKSGVVIVLDENNNPREVENRGNNYEVFVQENLIEQIENLISEITKILKERPAIEELNKKRYIPFGISTTTIASLASPYIDSLIRGDNSHFTNEVMTRFGLMTEAQARTIVYLMLFSILGILIDSQRYFENKEYIDDTKGLILELEILKTRLQVELEKLQLLKNTPTTPMEETKLQFIPIDSSKEEADLDSYRTLYYNIGYYIDKYYKAYQKGTLEALLQKKGYEEPNIQRMTECVKEKGPVLARRKTSRRIGRNQDV